MRTGGSMVRRADGFARFAIALQYHGASFLGFTYQGEKQEDCILADGTDLRGYRSVEGRLREALNDLLGSEHEQWENIQVSSRTDRGVHALKNTLHVDVWLPKNVSSDPSDATAAGLAATASNTMYQDVLQKLRRGLNFHLSRQQPSWERDSNGILQPRRRRRRTRGQQQLGPSYTFLGKDSWVRRSANNDVRILSVAKAPEYMINEYALSHSNEVDQPPVVDWNARFSATQRTYVYRILCLHDGDDEEDDCGIPFEWDRSWRIRGMRCDRSGSGNSNSSDIHSMVLDISAMRDAAKHMEGRHDFSTFRGAKCQRQSPIVSIHSISIHSQPYGHPLLMTNHHHHHHHQYHDGTSNDGWSAGGLLGFGSGDTKRGPQLVTIAIVGDSFLYRQVRNMVGCLVEVGKGRLSSGEVPGLLQAKDRSLAPSMAPAHGLFLLDVQHGNFHF